MHVVVPITLIVVQEMGIEKHHIMVFSRMQIVIRLAQSVLMAAGSDVRALTMDTAIHTLKMHVKTLLVVCVQMVAVWDLMVSAPVAVLLITAQYKLLNIYSVSLLSML